MPQQWKYIYTPLNFRRYLLFYGPRINQKCDILPATCRVISGKTFDPLVFCHVKHFFLMFVRVCGVGVHSPSVQSPSTLPHFSFMLWSKRLLVSLKFGLYCLGQYFNNCSPSLCCYVWQFTGNWTHLLWCPGSVDIHHCIAVCSWIRHLNHWEVVDVSCSCCCGYGTESVRPETVLCRDGCSGLTMGLERMLRLIWSSVAADCTSMSRYEMAGCWFRWLWCAAEAGRRSSSFCEWELRTLISFPSPPSCTPAHYLCVSFSFFFFFVLIHTS